MMGVFMLQVLSTREFVLGSNCELLRIFCSPPYFGFGEDFKGCLRSRRAALVTGSLRTCGNDGTTSTGQMADRTVPSATLPTNARRNPVRPCVEMMIKSARSFATKSWIVVGQYRRASEKLASVYHIAGALLQCTWANRNSRRLSSSSPGRDQSREAQ
jgi:hypothetical protein